MQIQIVVPTLSCDAACTTLAGPQLEPGNLIRSTHTQITGVVLEIIGDLANVYFGHGPSRWFRWDGEGWTSQEALLSIVE